MSTSVVLSFGRYSFPDPHASRCIDGVPTAYRKTSAGQVPPEAPGLGHAFLTDLALAFCAASPISMSFLGIFVGPLTRVAVAILLSSQPPGVTARGRGCGTPGAEAGLPSCLENPRLLGDGAGRPGSLQSLGQAGRHRCHPAGGRRGLTRARPLLCCHTIR